MLCGLAGLLLLGPAGAWADASRHPPEDPFESLNRKSFAFSMALDRKLIAPLSRLSAGLTPGPLGRAIHNIVVNLSEPVVLINDLLQTHLRPAAKAGARLVVNSTIGLLGAVDVAARLGLRHHPNGFGDTLGHYGVKAGPYLYVPVLGPSSVRDLFGSAVDQFSNPLLSIRYPYKSEVYLGVAVFGGLDERARRGPELTALLSSAADPYATLRSTYLQAREAQIRGDASLPELPDIQSAPAAPEPPRVTAASPGLDPAPEASTGPPAPETAAPSPLPAPAMPGGPAPPPANPAPA